jgi:hypothetical protein
MLGVQPMEYIAGLLGVIAVLLFMISWKVDDIAKRSQGTLSD